jgi:hypothetical protein
MARWIKLDDCMFDADRFLSVQRHEFRRWDGVTNNSTVEGVGAYIVVSQKGAGVHNISTKHSVTEVQEVISKVLGI